MKIAILSPFYPFRGGIASFSNSLYKELEKTHEVKAFSFSKLYPNFLFPGKTQYVEDSDPSIKIESSRVLNSINPISYIKTAKAINRYNPDILIIAYWMPFMAPALGTVCRFVDKKTKKIALVHNAIPHEKSFIDRAFAKYFFRQCDGFITLSESVKSDVQQFVPNAKIMLYPHPVYDHYKDRFDKVTACEKLNVSADKNNILFFGLIREYKGLDLLIEATNFLNEDYQLIIAGESYEDFKKYQDLIDASPLKNNIKVFAQYIPDNMVTTLFSASDLLVLPYRSATQSGVVTVAYQLELPMVATDVGGLGSTIRSANTGIVTKDITPQGIANAILDFFNSNEKNIFIENIRKEKDRLSWKSFVSNLDKFLNKDIL